MMEFWNFGGEGLVFIYCDDWTEMWVLDVM
jgi:hypothetical protein